MVINDSIAVYAYLAETGDTSVKIATTTGEKSEQGFAARKNSGLLPDLNKALDELRADGTLADISQKYLKANASGGPEAGQAQHAPRSTWQLILDSLWPLAQGRDHQDDPADGHQLRHRPGDRAGRGAGAAVVERGPHQRRAVLHLDHPRHPTAGAAVHRVLRAARNSG